jgi:acetoin utilization deacetylase AcuC-like enzyme
MSMLVLHDPRCADYWALGHPEKPERVTHTAAYLQDTFPAWTWSSGFDEVPDKTLLLAHTAAHLARLEQENDFDPDTRYLPGIGQHARRAVAAALLAARHAHDTGRPAFSLMRPPGHHATANQAMGFCYLNQVAIAALAAMRDFDIRRVAIWDFDAHHCNGTESILLGREGILVSSVHQSPGYPGTGLHDLGNIRNWPVPPDASRESHMDALRASLDAIVGFRPELVLVSAGFDAYAGDPLTEMTLEAEDFASLGHWLQHTGIPAAAVLEGGYSADLPVLVGEFLGAWSE